MNEIATLETNSHELAGWIADELRPPAVRRGVDLKVWAEEFRDVYRVSEALAKTPFVPKEMMGKTADVAAAIMKGRELGMSPFDALGSVYVIHGRVGFYAEFMRRRIIEAGHKLRIVESTDNRCVIEGRRKNDTEDEKVRVTYTVEQAKKNGVNLGAYPSDKLVARATSRICRQHFPDVLAGSLIAEDLMDGLVPASAPEAATAAPDSPAIARKRAPRKAAEAVATQPPTAPKKAAESDDELAELLDGPEPPEEPIVMDAEEVPDPAPDPVPDPDGITPAQLKKMSAMLTECGFEDRETRHAFVQTAINRTITSAKDLTKAEAAKVIDILANSELIEP